MYLFIFILLLCLTTKTYLSPQILVYLPIDVPFHDPTCSFSYFISDETLRSTRQRFYSSAWLCLSVYFHVSLSSNHKDLPVTTCTRVYPFMSYLFSFILQFRQTAKIYPSAFLLRCMTMFIVMHLIRLTTKIYLSPQLLVCLPIHVPVHDPTCSFSYFNSD